MNIGELNGYLCERKALIVHCSRLGKIEVLDAALLFPEDLTNAIQIFDDGKLDLSCSLVWPDHIKTYGTVGLILKLRDISSIVAICPQDAGALKIDNGTRISDGVPFSREAVVDTFENSCGHNEWRIKNAATIGIFINQNAELLVDAPIKYEDMDDYDSSIKDLVPSESTIASQVITVEKIGEEFPQLPVYGYNAGKIEKIQDAKNCTG